MVKNNLGQYFAHAVRCYRKCTSDLLEKFKDNIVRIEYPTIYSHYYRVILAKDTILSERLKKDIAITCAKYHPMIQNLRIQLDEPQG